jgi:hypothetical protein
MKVGKGDEGGREMREMVAGGGGDEMNVREEQR